MPSYTVQLSLVIAAEEWETDVLIVMEFRNHVGEKFQVWIQYYFMKHCEIRLSHKHLNLIQPLRNPKEFNFNS